MISKKQLFSAIQKQSDWGILAQAVVLDILKNLNPKWAKEMHEWMCKQDIITCEGGAN